MSVTQLNLAKTYRIAELSAKFPDLVFNPASNRDDDAPFELTAESGLGVINQQIGHEGSGFTAESRGAILGGASVTFASLLYVTYHDLSALNKSRGFKVAKVTRASVQLFSNIVDRELYSKQILRAAGRFDDAQDLPESWVKSPAWFYHSNECYSVVKHTRTHEQYLYAVYNEQGTTSQTYIYNPLASTKDSIAWYAPAMREDCASLMTPSAAADFLKTERTVYNKTNDITHNMTLRTLKMRGIVNMKAMGLQVNIFPS
jgi:hypothetical protein